MNPDAANNLTSDPSSSSGAKYAWDGRNLLKSVAPNGGSVTDDYTYDAAGRRTTVVSGGVTTTYLYDGSSPVVISNPTATRIVSLPGSNEILTIGGLVATHDALGSTLGLVNSSGATVTGYTYDPFGNFTMSGTPTSGYGKVFAMAGIEFDPTGLYHAKARYYHPTLQRFISEDPARQRGSGPNLFAYAGNSPVGSSDPSGLDVYDDYANQSGGGSDSPGGNLAFDFVPIVGFIISLIEDPSSAPILHTRLQMTHEFLKTALTIGVTVAGGQNLFVQAAPRTPPPEFRKPGVMPVGFPGHTGCVPGQPCGPAQTEREPLSPSVCGNFFACTSAVRAGCIFGCGAGTPEDVPFLCIPGCTVIGGIGCKLTFPCRVPRTFPLPGPPS